jgi:hypothetical protein
MQGCSDDLEGPALEDSCGDWELLMQEIPRSDSMQQLRLPKLKRLKGKLLAAELFRARNFGFLEREAVTRSFQRRAEEEGVSSYARAALGGLFQEAQIPVT